MYRMIRPALVGGLSSLSVFGAGDGTVAVKGHRFLAEVAATQQEQQKGLMFRKSLDRDRCMIFIYREDGAHSIWMKNCLISLDVVWVAADGKIVEMAERVPPCSPMRGDDCPVYGGTVDARHFIEFAAGTIKRLGLKQGDRVGWDLKLDDGTRVVGGAAVPAEKGASKGRARRKTA